MLETQFNGWPVRVWLRALGSDEPFVRRYAQRFLNAVDAECDVAVGDLIGGLRAPRSEVRETAIALVDRLGPCAGSAWNAMRSIAANASDPVSCDARRALAHAPQSTPTGESQLHYGGQSLEHWFAVLARIDRDHETAMRMIHTVGPEAAEKVPFLIGLLESEPVEVRKQAALVLGNIGPGAVDAAGPLAGQLVEQATFFEALEALEKIGDEAVKAAVPSLIYYELKYEEMLEETEDVDEREHINSRRLDFIRGIGRFEVAKSDDPRWPPLVRDLTARLEETLETHPEWAAFVFGTLAAITKNNEKWVSALVVSLLANPHADSFFLHC